MTRSISAVASCVVVLTLACEKQPGGSTAPGVAGSAGKLSHEPLFCNNAFTKATHEGKRFSGDLDSARASTG